MREGRLRLLATFTALALLAGCDRGDDRGAAPPSTPGAGGDSQVDTAAVSVCHEADSGEAGGPMRLADATDRFGAEDALAGMMVHAVAAGDVDGDGWVDLFVGTFADRPADAYRRRGADGPAPDRLLRGGPDGFRPDPSFPRARGRTSGAAFADLDRDGDLDLVVARNHREGPAGDAPSVVMRNDRGAFTVTATLDDRRGARSVGVLDFDGDGLLDLFLVVDRFGDGSSVLLQNTGGLRFEDATAASGLPDELHGLGVVAADLSADRRADLFVAGSNRLFVNRDGRFEEVGTDVFDWQTYGPEDDPAGAALGDLNRDGRPDLVVGQHFNSTLDEDRRVAVRAYLNLGNDDGGAPRFRDVTEESGLVPLPTKAPHVEVVDLDADGWPDVLTSASADRGTRPAVFRNLGAEGGAPRFEAPAGLGDARYWVAGVTFDVDRDGRIDVFLGEFDPGLPSPLLRNEGGAGHWLGVQVGPAGAQSLGVTVEVFEAGAGGEPDARLGATEITAAAGYGSGAWPAAWFGLGEETSVDLLVREPGEPEPLRVPDVEADRQIQLGGGSGAADGC